jgi:hypothetical protein
VAVSTTDTSSGTTTERRLHDIVLIDAACCGGESTEAYETLLRERFANQARVRLHYVGTPECTEIARGLYAQGARNVPIVALNGELLWHGQLPNWLDLISAIDERMSRQSGDER